ncbi:hypothetical protein AGDE_11282 [Angomonas deanei]|nr:hypothetical protein AGDE_11282 [Angomonas deanei]|eukprot:EPY26479.1 hypothetical protein AGDE_11282 [Angomonas deanei]
MKRVRVHPEVEDLTDCRRKQLILSAYAKAKAKGLVLMQEAERNIYRQFLKDLKPIVLGIRDNPEFFTVAEDTVETHSGVLRQNEKKEVYRTIPAAKAFQPTDAVKERFMWEKKWLQSPQGKAWSHTLRGKEYLSLYSPTDRPRGAPGAKKNVLPLEILAPYTRMDESRLLRRNWMAYLDNKHVAETMWTRAKISDSEKRLRTLQQTGQAWHRPIHKEAADRW